MMQWRPQNPSIAETLFSLSRVTKHYPGVTALRDVDLSVSAGEVVGLIGENGAGKSTLMNILGGVTVPSSGTIHLNGEERPNLTVPDAIKGGIAFVHQELNLFENLSVAANIMIGREPLVGGPLRLVDRKRLRELAEPLLVQLGADFGTDTLVAELTLAQRQLVEIAKALSLNARILILDEPTSSLTVTETDRLLRVVARLKANGVGVIFISHRLGEVKRCADRVIVLRDGRVVAELGHEMIEQEIMIRHMIGRELKMLYRPPAEPVGDKMLELVGLRTAYRPDRSISLDVRQGEILGLAGLVGSGRTELARTVFGIEPPLAGEIRVGGETVAINKPAAAIALGLYLVPEDRKRSGLLLDFSVAKNVSLANLSAVVSRGLFDAAAETRLAWKWKDRLAIRCSDTKVPAASLSGGNQQKVVLAKWLSMTPRVLIFDEPTRGIDVGAKHEIYTLMRSLADSGTAILMISSDMEEVIGVSDCIAVMHEGAISGTLTRDCFSEENILSLAVGRVLN
ncbi:sugar ABC transporter ATP-binding protein [Chelativorans sp. EGI FJ00035]|uniref:Sugar ABC transporter ATP-binding protein n=1 Tax=Chelativorans salis TaxID=2978478 RepID=A0ABT2LMP3_9HYPH|nr:sugar ABC transporter ATP-binding protein [Chelativorans sp. EGI FJ00035]MCT7374673.1 sugar ABC transporter ATP-binding protein [Chelativorans sp. EGI FJ00035]